MFKYQISSEKFDLNLIGSCYDGALRARHIYFHFFYRFLGIFLLISIYLIKIWYLH